MKRALTQLSKVMQQKRKLKDLAETLDDFDELLVLSEKKARLSSQKHRYRNQINAVNAIKDAMGRNYDGMYAPLQLYIQNAIITLEITDILKLSGVAESGSGKQESGSPLFAKLLYDDGFWKAKFANDFPDLYFLYNGKVPDYVQTDRMFLMDHTSKSKWRQWYFTIRYLYRTQVYPIILDAAKEMSSGEYDFYEFKLVDYKIYPNTTNLIKVSYEMPYLRKYGNKDMTIQEVAYWFIWNHEPGASKNSAYTFFLLIRAFEFDHNGDTSSIFKFENDKIIPQSMLAEFMVSIHQQLSNLTDKKEALLQYTNNTTLEQIVSKIDWKATDENGQIIEFNPLTLNDDGIKFPMLYRHNAKMIGSNFFIEVDDSSQFHYETNSIEKCITCFKPAKWKCQQTGDLFCSHKCAK